MSKNTTKKSQYKSVLAESPEELAERMTIASTEIVALVKAFAASDAVRMARETRHLDAELQSKAGFKHLVRGVVALAVDNPETVNLAVAKAMLWTEARLMSRRGARRPALAAVEDISEATEEPSIPTALRPLHGMTQREIAFTGSRVEALARQELEAFGQSSPMTGPGLVRAFDEAVASQLTEITDRKDARVPLPSDSPHRAYLLDIRGALAKSDLTRAVAMMLTMEQSTMPLVRTGAADLLEVIR